jgi:hypothetical protein
MYHSLVNNHFLFSLSKVIKETTETAPLEPALSNENIEVSSNQNDETGET